MRMSNRDNSNKKARRIVKRRPFLKTVGAGVLATPLAGCSADNGGNTDGGGSSEEIPDTLKFGATFPISGGRSAVSPWYTNAWDLFIERASPVEIGGKEVELEIEVLDDQNDVNRTLQNTRDLLEDTHILLGTYGNENIQAVAQVASNNGTFTFNTGGAGLAPHEQWGGRDGHIVAPLGLGGNYTDGFLTELSGLSPEPAKLGLVTPDASIYHDMSEGTKEFADERGWDYVEEVIALDAEDLSPVIQRFRDENVDVYMNLGGYNHGIPMVTALRRLDIVPKAIYFGYEVQNPEMEESMGNDAEWFFGMNWYHRDLDLEVTEGSPWETTQDFIEDVNSSDMMDSQIDYHQAWAAASMEIPLTVLMRTDWDSTSWDEVVGDSGAISRDYMVPAIYDEINGEDTLEGPFELNEVGMNAGLISFAVQLHEDLEPAIVGPDDWGVDEIQNYPFPGWE